MSRYRGPRFKKIRRLGALPGLTNKKPKTRNSRRTQSRFVKKKISISYSSTRKTKIAVSLWSYRTTIT